MSKLLQVRAGRIAAGLLLLSTSGLARAQGAGEIFYDSFEQGRLVGGVIAVDPADPMHTQVGPLDVVRGSTAVTVIDNGPTSNRIDIVLVGDGYTAGELGTYAGDVSGMLASFFAETPLTQYASYFNVHRVDVVSNESGVDNDPTQGIQRDTAMDMGYWCSGIERLLCVNVGAALSQAANAPAVDQVLALANSTKYGGAGYPSSDLGTLAARNGSAVEIALHEFGHSFADLADEYDYGGPTTYTGSEIARANVSIFDAAAQAAGSLKWYRWLSAPIVDSFEGAFYSEFGVYRPTDNSLMRNLGRPFQLVNREQFLIKIYEAVDPIDDASPAGSYAHGDTLFVDPLQPTDHALDIQWSVDGTPVSGATSETLFLATLNLGPGTHTVSVEVVDNTPWVRDEGVRAAHMTSTRSWTVTDVAEAIPYGCDPQATGSLSVLAGAPIPGTTLTFGVDNVQGFHAAGAAGLLFLNQDAFPLFPCGFPIADLGLTPGTSGELLLAPGTELADPLVGPSYAGQGNPVPFPIVLPPNPALIGQSIHVQGLLFDPAATLGVRFGLTDARRVRFGS